MARVEYIVLDRSAIAQKVEGPGAKLGLSRRICGSCRSVLTMVRHDRGSPSGKTLDFRDMKRAGPVEEQGPLGPVVCALGAPQLQPLVLPQLRHL